MTKYYYKDNVIPECNHSNCHYPYFNQEYKLKLRREFRQLTVQKRKMLFETTTQRILLYLDSKYKSSDDDISSHSTNIDYPFSIHCFLPWNGSLVSVCKQFYCHTLKISYNMLELHHQTIWKTSQNNRNDNIIDAQPKVNNKNNIDEIYQCYLPQIIESFNTLPIDATSYSQNGTTINLIENDIELSNLYQSNPNRNLTKMMKFGYPKLKLNRKTNYKKSTNRNRNNSNIYNRKPRINSAKTRNGNDYRRRQFEKHMRQKARDEKTQQREKKKTKKNDKKEETEEEEEPKLLLGFLRFNNNDDELRIFFLFLLFLRVFDPRYVLKLYTVRTKIKIKMT